MVESSQVGLKTMWEKEKLLLTSNFSFSHSVFIRPVLQIPKTIHSYLQVDKNWKVAMANCGDRTCRFKSSGWLNILKSCLGRDLGAFLMLSAEKEAEYDIN